MNMMTILIQPSRLKEKGVGRLLPLINFFDKQTMLSWLDMRIITLDYGLRFYTRIQLYTAFYIVVYLSLGILFLAQFFGSKLQFFTPYQWIPLIFEIFNFFHFILYMCISAAKINSVT